MEPVWISFSSAQTLKPFIVGEIDPLMIISLRRGRKCFTSMSSGRALIISYERPLGPPDLLFLQPLRQCLRLEMEMGDNTLENQVSCEGCLARAYIVCVHAGRVCQAESA